MKARNLVWGHGLTAVVLTALGCTATLDSADPDPLDARIGDAADMAAEPEPAPQPAPQPGAEPAPQPTPEPVPMPEFEPAPMPEPMPAPMPEPMPEPAPQPTAEPEPAPQPAPEPAPPPGMACVYQAIDFNAPEREYDVMGASDERLRFDVPALPAADQAAAQLSFRIFDADHPGQEGRIWVNGMGPFEIPADAALDNQFSDAVVDVTGATRPGGNVVEFGSSLSEPRTFYRISRVALTVTAVVDECDAPPPPPPPEAVERSIGYRQARYTQRQHWSVRCNDYAFTARGEEHVGPDCDGLFRAGGPRTGTAVFTFENLVEATYEVVIRSRHTENRNPAGALFIVDGEERRISQRSDRDRTNDVWGRKRLSGTIDVVLDSTREDQSDSIISVTLRPVGP